MTPPTDDVTELVEGALQLRNAGRRRASLALFQAAAQIQPHHRGLHLEAAFDCLNLGRLDEAEATYGIVLRLCPGEPAAHLGLGHCARARNDHTGALAAFGHALQAQPGRVDILLEMVIELRALGLSNEADARLAEAQAIEPSHPEILVQLAEQARRNGDPARLLAVYREGAARVPGHLGLQLGFADALAMGGDMEKAIAHLAGVESHLRASAALRARQISLLRSAGFWPEAWAMARGATDAWPGDPALWLERLACEELLGTQADIDLCLAQAPAHTAPERARLERARARVQEDRGQIDDAMASYDAADALEPGAAETHFFRARLCLSRQRLPHARDALRAYVRAINPSQPINISQTHFGQILDELSLDAGVLGSLQAAKALPVSARVGDILRIVRANPDSTAAAIALVHAIDASGLLGVAAFIPCEGGGEIPRVLVQFWDTPEVPPDVEVMMQSWAGQNPDCTAARFCTLTAEAFMRATYSPAAATVFASIGHPAQKADVFRLGYLAARGGIYVDADDRCHAPLGRVLPPGAAMVLYQEDFGTLGNNFMAVAPNHPVILAAFRQALESVARGDSETIWLSSGPGLITRAIAQSLAAAGTHWRRWFESNLILRRHDLFECAAIHCQAAYKLGGLHWGDTAGRRQ